MSSSDTALSVGAAPDASRGTTSRRGRQLVWAAPWAAAALVPAVLGESQTAHLATTVALAIGLFSLNSLLGYAGQVSLGQAAFVGTGAFAAVHLGGRGLPLAVQLLGAGLAVGCVAAVVGLPSLRIRGLAVAVATLVYGIAAQQYLFETAWFTGTRWGLSLAPVVGRGPVYRMYLVALAALAAVWWLDRHLLTTKLGRAFLAVRDGEERAVAFGVRPGPSKLRAYALSGFIAGLAGALIAALSGVVQGADFGVIASLEILALTVVGGMGSRTGVLAAAALFHGLPGLLPNVDERLAPLAGGVALVVVVLFLPGGIGGLLERGRRGRSAGASSEPRAHRSTTARELAPRADDLRVVPRPLTLRLPARAVLEARDVRVRFGGVQALAGVDLEVREGEIVGLIGANGAGKSTFFDVVSGFTQPQVGSQLLYRGRDLLASPAWDRSSLGIARTFQHMGLLRPETVGDNVLLAQHWLADYPPIAGILGIGDARFTEQQLRRRTSAALSIFGLDALEDRRLGALPYGTMRMVEVAAAVASGAEIIFVDEASAGLGPREAVDLGRRLRALRDGIGVTLVVIEHHVPLIADICDYVYCLASGQLIAEGPPASVQASPEVVEQFLGTASDGGTVGTATREPVHPEVPVAVARLLEVEGLTAGYGDIQVLHGVELDIGEGEIVALLGSNGVGKTTTLKTIVGLLHPTGGKVDFRGEDIAAARPEDLVRRGLVLCPEGRGMLGHLTVRENLELGAYATDDPMEVRERLERAMDAYPILRERQHQRAGSLSGGEQQMLAIVRATMSAPQLLLIDEASMGLSPIMAQETFRLIRSLCDEHGTSVLVVEQNVLALDIADRAFVMERGQIQEGASGAGLSSLRRRLRDVYLGSAA